MSTRKRRELNIPENVETIRSSAFLSNYPNLTKLVLPVGIKNVTFDYSKVGSEIYYNGTVEQWDKVTKKFVQTSIKTVHCTDGDVSI